jgi:hypothetical protein
MMAAVILEAALSSEQADRLARLMSEGKATRPAGVVAAALLYENGVGTLVACWADRDVLDDYLATTEVPRGVQLLREVGAEPSLRIVELLELG